MPHFYRLLGLILLLSPLTCLGQQETVTVSVINGDQIRCATDSIVEVMLAPNPNRTLTEMRLFWTVDSDPIIIQPDASFSRTHTYDLLDILDECAYDCNFSNGFCRTIRVVASYETGSDENNSLDLTFKLPPDPEFAPFITCVDNPVAIENLTCPNNDEDMTYNWDFGNGQTSTEMSPIVTYEQAGRYAITLSATNLCGTETFTRIVEVLEPAEAVAIADSNITSVNGDTYILCAEGIASTRLVASASSSVGSIQWTGSSGVTFLDDRRLDTVRVQFNGPGTYTVNLVVDNACNAPSERELTFEVIEAQSLALFPAGDACLERSYTPEPLFEDAEYIINGTTYAPTDFPVTLTASPNPYRVEARLSNACGEQIRRDSFRVITPEPVEITSPSQDTSLCASNPPLTLTASRSGGFWRRDGVPVNEQFNPTALGPGTYQLTYAVGTGSCRVEAQRTVEVLPGPQLDLGGDQEICVDADILNLTANETGGVWSGPGIIDSLSGQFDPSVTGSGTFSVSYRFERPGDGCRSVADQEITVVDLPTVDLPDSILVCDSESPIGLNPLVNPQVAPVGGTFSWSGPGVADNALNTQVVGGTGAYPLTLTYTIGPGCRRADTLIARIDALTQAFAMPDTTLCNNQGTLSLIARPAGGQWTGPNGTIVGNQLDLSRLPVGQNTLTYVLSPGTTCESRDETIIEVVAADGLSAGDDLYVCETETAVSLPDRPGQWTGPNLDATNRIDLSGLEVGTYTYTLTDASLPPACNSDQLDVLITPLPQPDFSPDSTGCMGTPLVMNNNTDDADNYRWQFGNGVASTDPDPSIAYATAGTYTITLEALTQNPLTSDELCRASTTRTVRIFAPPERVAFEPDIRQGCSPLTVNFTNRSVGERLDYVWSLGAGRTVTEDNPQNITFEAGLRDTTFAIRLTVGNGCGDRAAVDSIRVFAQPTARFATEIQSGYCSGETVQFGHRALGDSLVWDFGNGQTYTGEEPPDQTYFTGSDQNDTVQLRLLAYNRCGVDTALQDLVIVPTDARADITVLDDQPCVGDTILLESLSRPLDARVEWLLPDGSRREGRIVPIAFSEPGLQEVQARVFSCGRDSATVRLNVQPLPEAELIFPPQSCPGEPVRVQLQTNGIPSLIQVDSLTFSGQDVVTVRWDALGRIPVRAEARTAAGCQVTLEEELEWVSGPQARWEALDSVCVGEAVALNSMTDGVSSCTWSLGDGTRLTGCSVSHVFAEAGIQSAQLTVANSIGCRDSLSRSVFIRPTPEARLAVDVLESCTPALIRLVNNSSGENGLTWSLPGGQTGRGDTVTLVQDRGGTYRAQLTVSSDGVCFAEAEENWTIFGTPDLEAQLSEGCTQAEGYQLDITSEPVAAMTVTGPNYQRAGTRHRALQPGDYLITAETTNRCVADTLVSVPAVNELLVQLEGPDSVGLELGQTLPLNLGINQAGTTLSWSPAEFVADPTAAVTQARPLRSGPLVATVSDVRGCVVRDTVQVTVTIDRERGIFIPDAFTPNGDGNNDVFMVRSANPGLARVEQMRIYGPGGDLVFERADAQANASPDGWDGSFRGQPARAGVYVYWVELLFVDGERIVRKGDLTLIR